MLGKSPILVSIILLQCIGIYAETCDDIEGLKGCACRWSGSKNITSLQVLSYNSTVEDRRRFETVDTKDTQWKFAYNPCGSFDLFPSADKSCKDATVGRFTQNSVKQCFNIGGPSSATFRNEVTLSDRIVSNLTISYKYPPSQAAVVSLICNSAITPANSVFRYINVTEGIEETYYFSLESSCCCPGGCHATMPIPSGSSMLCADKSLYEGQYITWLLDVLSILMACLLVIAYNTFNK